MGWKENEKNGKLKWTKSRRRTIRRARSEARIQRLATAIQRVAEKCDYFFFFL